VAGSTFRCRLITPDAVVLDEPATNAVVPAWDGLFGVLPNRAPIVAQLGTGELRIDFPDKGSAKGGSRSFFVDDGFVQMLDNKLTILAARAVAAEALSEADAQAEFAAVSGKTADGLTPAEAERLAGDKRRAEAKVRAAKNFRARGAI
jgi:F-type H+-transporting ATPase subunit epsilon